MTETRMTELSGQFSSAGLFEPYVVQDGQLVTGQSPPSSVPTAEAVIAAIQQTAAV